uniref:DUF19 domain-containing protein n=1 Tax=Caenorhabditis tropicalis TaxID=1561998 RepID=A0A1I7V2C4_9PELO
MLRFQTPLLFSFLVHFVCSLPLSIVTNPEVIPCLLKFYDAAYKGSFNCTKAFDFFSEVPSIKQEAYTSGKSCFLEVIEDKCTPSQSTFLSKNYDQLVGILTEKPVNGTSCDDFYYKYNALKCSPYLADFTMKAMTLATNPDVKFVNNSKVWEMIDICDEIENCISPVCYYEDYIKNTLLDSCEEIKLSVSDFSLCFDKMIKNVPSPSDYPCLEGKYSSFEKKTVEMFTVKKICMKQIMKDYCGEKAIVDFDKNAEIMMKADDPLIKHEALTTGKSCFMEVIKEKCNMPQYTFLSKNYDQLVDILTEKPANETNCDDIYYKFNAIKCEPILEIFSTFKFFLTFGSESVLVSKTRNWEMVRMCDRVEPCTKPVCYAKEADRKSWKKTCEETRLGVSDFASCIEKITVNPPKASEYPCLDGSGDITETVEMFTVKKICMKQIMKDYCGEKAIVDFDKNAEILVNAFKRDLKK